MGIPMQLIVNGDFEQGNFMAIIYFCFLVTILIFFSTPNETGFTFECKCNLMFKVHMYTMYLIHLQL